MPRDGSGGYNRYTPGTPYVTGTTISSTVVNNELNDVAAALAASIAKDGQTVPTNNLPMGGYRHTGVGNATARDSYAALGQVQDGGSVYASAGGTGDALTLTLSPAPSAYVAGQEFRFKATATNTGAATIDVNSLGAKSIKRDGSSALAAGDITTGQMYSIRYDGTNFQLLNASTFVTQAVSNSSTLPATTAFVMNQTATAARKGITQQAAATDYVTGTDPDLHLTVKVARDNNLVLGTATATTSGTSKDYTGIPTWAKRVVVMLSGVSTNGTSPKMLKVGSGSIAGSGYLSATTFLLNGAGVAVTNYTDGFSLGGNSASDVIHGAVTFTHMGSNIWICHGSIGFSSGAAVALVGGSITLGGALDRIRLTTQGGTDAFDAGSFNIIYE